MVRVLNTHEHRFRGGGKWLQAEIRAVKSNPLLIVIIIVFLFDSVSRAGTRPNKQVVIVSGIYLGVWLCIGRVLLTY